MFPGSPGSSGETGRPRYMFANLTFSLENIIIVSIVMVMVMVFCFSLGVERGRRLMRPQSMPVEKVQPAVVPAIVVPQAVTQKPGVKTEAVVAAQPATQEVLPVLKDVYTIQVASFKQKSFAQKEATLLQQKGFDIFVVPKGGHSIVCVGKFIEKKEAQTFASKIPRKYKDYVIRRL